MLKIVADVSAWTGHLVISRLGTTFTRLTSVHSGEQFWMLGKMGMPVFVTTRKCHKELVRHIVKDVYSYYVPDKYDDSNSNKSNLEKNGRSHDYKGDHIAG